MIRPRALRLLETKLSNDMRQIVRNRRQISVAMHHFDGRYRHELAQLQLLRCSISKAGKTDQILPEARSRQLLLMQSAFLKQNEIVKHQRARLNECRQQLQQIVEQQQGACSKLEKVEELSRVGVEEHQQRVEHEHVEEIGMLSYSRNLHPTDLPETVSGVEELEPKRPHQFSQEQRNEERQRASIRVPLDDQPGDALSLEIALSFAGEVAVEIEKLGTPSRWLDIQRERQIRRALQLEGIAVESVTIQGRHGR